MSKQKEYSGAGGMIFQWPGNRFTMRALTLWSPWGSAIVRGSKDVENRGWAVPEWLIGETIAIHNGQRWDPACLSLWEEIDGDVPDSEILDAEIGCIVGVAKIVRCDPPSGTLADVGRVSRDPCDSFWRHPWAFGWCLDERRSLDKPIPWKGRQGVWKLPSRLRDEMRVHG